MFSKDHTHFHHSIKIGSNILEMIWIEGGNYQMRGENYKQHIRLSDFWIGKFPVTQGLYQAVMGANPSHFRGANKPVEQVNWQDCKVFTAKLNDYEEVKKLKLFFRLPTEAEWEYAASNRGSANYVYAGDDDLATVGWYDENSPNQSMEVGLKKPNELGIYDLNGNVWEWCEDDYSSDAFEDIQANMPNPVYINGKMIRVDNSLISDAHRLYSLSNKVNKGGSWRDGVRCCMLANRDTYTANLRLDIIGFRLVCVEINS